MCQVVFGDDERMRDYMSGSPKWVVAVIAGAFYGTGMGIFVKSDGSSWTATIISAVVLGVGFGIPSAFWFDKQRRQMRAAEGDLPTDKLKSAHHAAERGPIPEDPEVRAAARRIATHQLQQLQRTPRLVVIGVPAALLVVVVIGSVTDSPWNLIFAVAPVFVLIGQLSVSRRARRRIELLSDPTEH
jgi:Flp pilus assembly protein TadB